MPTIDIKRGAATILSPNIDDSSILSKMLNGQDIITLSFEWDSFTEILVGDKISWNSIDYYCNQAPDFKKVSAARYQYTIRFEGPHYALIKVLFLLEGEGEFYLVGTASDFVDLIVSNLNRVYGGGTYSKGSVDSTDYKNLQFSGEDCFTVLQRICDEFDLEFYFTGSGYVINLTDEVGNSTGLTFQYHDGLRNIRRTKVGDKDLITRLYAFGSEKNIETTYGSRRLKLPSGTYPNGYMEQNTGTYGIREAVKTFEDVSPHFEGVVDSSPTNNQIVDAALDDFNLNDYLIEGVVAKIVFNTGDLAGYEFEISDYNHSTKTVTFNSYTDDQGLVLPNDSLNPATGNKYTFVDIEMPTSYITAAEGDLATAATSYLGEMSSPNVLYDIEMDWHELMKDTISLDVGDEITVTDAQLAPGGVTFRILELTQSLANQYKYSVKVGQSLLINYFQKVAGRQDRSERTIIVHDDTNVTRVRREYLRTEELRDIIFDPEGYFDPVNIKPLSIETGMLAVGMKSQQFVLKNVRFYPNKDANQNKIDISAGDLVHLTIDETIKTWTMSSYSNSSLTTGNTYYIYAKCDRDGATGVFLLSTNQYKVTEGTTDWYFLIGVLHAAVDGVRALSLTYGHTTVNGKFITTGKIQSQDTLTYFDLDNNIIQGKITFISGTGGYSNIGDKPAELADINTGEGTKLTGIETGAQVNVQSSPTIGIKINYRNWSTTNSGEAYIHGFNAAGIASDIDGFFYYNTVKYTVPRSVGDYCFLTNMTGSGYIVYRTGSETFTVNSNAHKVAFCKKENGIWYYDNNVSWIQFTPVSTDVVIGTIVCDTTDHIEQANIWGYGQDIKAVGEANSTAGAIWGTNLQNQPDALEDINAGEGTKLVGIEAGAQVNTSIPSVGIKINTFNWYQSQGGYGYVHGFNTAGDPADIDGFVIYNGAKHTINRKPSPWLQTIVTSQAGSGYIVLDTNGTRFTISSQARSIAFCKKENGIWYYDNFAAWISFTPDSSDIVIGTMVCDTTNHIEAAHVWTQGQDIKVVSEAAADNTSTIVDGGLITSGRIELGSGGTVKAGINGYGTAGSEIRIWAGETYANRASAPFRVNQDGEVVATIVTIQAKTDAFGLGTKIDGGDIWENVVNSLSSIKINRKGYNGGITQFRNTIIYNGKGVELVFISGETNTVYIESNAFLIDSVDVFMNNLPTSPTGLDPGQLYKAGGYVQYKT